MANKKREIDKRQFEEMCYYQCTQQEICNILDIDHKTLTKWCKETYDMPYSQVYIKYSDGGKLTLRRYQLNLAKTNSAMAIWLGKNWLGQRDNLDVSTNQLDEDAISKAIKESFKDVQ